MFVLCGHFAVENRRRSFCEVIHWLLGLFFDFFRYYNVSLLYCEYAARLPFGITTQLGQLAQPLISYFSVELASRRSLPVILKLNLFNFRFNLTLKLLGCNFLCSPAGKLFVSPLCSLSSFLCLPFRTSWCTSRCPTSRSSSSTTCRASRAGS